ncbi:hypothetical protein MNBD_NITROSPINAE01-376 [hydrothermal vent metagenome]|uniref:Uncharacterized protein n=1 Tax=hydrothermal vent metagenome TaxID=652676 RepID=A0A3B1CWK3_9ZZZZ
MKNSIAVALVCGFALFTACDPNTPVAKEKHGPVLEQLINGEHNINGFNRASGMLIDFMRDKKMKAEAEGKKLGNKFLEMEEIINEASLLASQSKYAGSFEKLKQVYDLLEEF